LFVITNFVVMSRTILKFDSEEAYDFLLIGIVCHQKDYKLCHELNRRLSLELARQEDYELLTPKHVKASEVPFV